MYLAISVDDLEESSNRKKTSNHDKDGIEYSKNIYNLDRNEQTMADVSEEGELLNSASFFLKLHTHFKIRITQKIHVFISL